MSILSEYYLNSGSNIVQLELFEISHAAFSKVYRVVRNAIAGVSVTLEDLSVQTFSYYPLRVVQGDNKDDLDQSLKLELGDLGEEIPTEIDRVVAGGFGTRPILKYRTYRSDILTSPLFGPVVLEVESFAFNKSGSILQARAPQLNLNRTGELYRVSRFSMLRNFL